MERSAPRHFSMVREFHLADFFTLGNAACGVGSILLAMLFMASGHREHFLAAAVLAPIAEEIYFRGYVFRAYVAQKGPLQAYLFSSVLFAVVHLNWQAFVPIFVVGLFLGFLYQRTGSVLPGIIAHAFNNAVAFTVLYFAP